MAQRRATLLASAARTATNNGSAVHGFGRYRKLAAQLVVSAASGTSPTLDVVLQHSIDGGTTWFTLMTFAQKTVAGNELKAEADVEGGTAELFGDALRVASTIGGTTPSFTYSATVVAED